MDRSIDFKKEKVKKLGQDQKKRFKPVCVILVLEYLRALYLVLLLCTLSCHNPVVLAL